MKLIHLKSVVFFLVFKYNSYIDISEKKFLMKNVDIPTCQVILSI